MTSCALLQLYLTVVHNETDSTQIQDVLDHGILNIQKLAQRLNVDININDSKEFSCNVLINAMYKNCNHSMIDEIVLIIAESVEEDYPCGFSECYDTSKVLVKKLQEYGFDAKLISGYFQLNEVDYESEEFLSRWVHEDDDSKAIHFWVVINDKVLDLTSKQFKDEIYDVLPLTVSCYDKDLKVNGGGIVFDSYDNLPNYHELEEIKS